MSLIDTHFHLDLFQNPAKLANEIERRKIYSIAVTNTPSVFYFSKNISSENKFIRAALGLHPELAEERIKELYLFERLLDSTKYVGEIGLDNIRRCTISSKKAQLEVFKKILDLSANAGNKILTIHSRGSEKETIEHIGPGFPGLVILHWYTGSLENLKNALKLGFYFSVNSAMCRSKNGRKIIENIPTSRMLTESDGPFIKGEFNLNSPLQMESTLIDLSKILGIKTEEVKGIIFENFKSIISVQKTLN